MTPGKIGKMTLGKVTPGQMTLGKVTPGQMTLGKMTPGQMTLGKVTPSQKGAEAGPQAKAAKGAGAKGGKGQAAKALEALQEEAPCLCKEKERHAWHLSSNYGVGQLEPVLEEGKA